MAVEVKQMIIKSVIVNDYAVEPEQRQLNASEVEKMKEQLRAQLLAECREMVAEQLNDARER